MEILKSILKVMVIELIRVLGVIATTLIVGIIVLGIIIMGAGITELLCVY